ncbi:MAG: site-specific integrase [Paramuribaculum sp.]|nr:site-specific integrase [Paramuribaculum sp.]
MDSRRARKGVRNAAGLTWAVINSVLDKMVNHFSALENDCFVSKRVMTVGDLRREFTESFGRKQSVRPNKSETQVFWERWAEFVEEMSVANSWTKATCQKFAALKKHILDWDSRVTFEALTERALQGFVAYLRDDLQMRNSTIGNQVGFLKWFLRWATAKGYNRNLAFQAFSPKLKTAANQVVFLEWQELMKVYDYVVPANGARVELTDMEGNRYVKTVHDSAAIAKARDIFCFCCFTSLRYSDAANLKRANIKGDVMTITTVKTADTITIELNKYAKSILERYADRDFGGRALPPMTNQRMNIYLKDLCELCGFNQPITRTFYRGSERIDETLPKFELIGTHTGRRTFICNALSLGIPAEVVMKWTGHSDYKSMKPYIDIANSTKAKAMELFNRL